MGHGEQQLYVHPSQTVALHRAVKRQGRLEKRKYIEE
jgi:hypothetical protein